jgi:Domain of unknown function (DUF4124)
VRTIAVLLLSLAPLLASAQVMKCLDGAGKVVGYASDCPPGTRPEQTGIRNAPAPAASSQKSLAERDAEFRKRQLEQKEATEKAEKKTAEVRERKEACEASQAYLKNLQGGQRIRKTDPRTGEPSFLTEADYPKEIASAQKAVTANCK